MSAITNRLEEAVKLAYNKVLIVHFIENAIRLLRPQKPTLIPELYTSHNRGYPEACYVTLYDTLLIPLEREIFFTSIFPT